MAGTAKNNPGEPEKLTPREFRLRIARQGGYIACKNDGRPGWSTIRKGWYDLMFMFQGAELMAAPRRPPNVGERQGSSRRGFAAHALLGVLYYRVCLV